VEGRGQVVVAVQRQHAQLRVQRQRPSTLQAPPSQGMALQAEIENRLRAQFAAAAGGSTTLSKAQAQRMGLGAVAAQFEQIDTRGAGQVSFEDWRRHLRAQAGSTR
jgi:hypothetical protein